MVLNHVLPEAQCAGAGRAGRGGEGQIAYEVLGSVNGTPLVLTPGGRSDGRHLRPFAECLLAEAKAAGLQLRVLVWDRRNMGSSGLQFGGYTHACAFSFSCSNFSFCVCSLLDGCLLLVGRSVYYQF